MSNKINNVVYKILHLLYKNAYKPPETAKLLYNNTNKQEKVNLEAEIIELIKTLPKKDLKKYLDELKKENKEIKGVMKLRIDKNTRREVIYNIHKSDL